MGAKLETYHATSAYRPDAHDALPYSTHLINTTFHHVNLLHVSQAFRLTGLASISLVLLSVFIALLLFRFGCRRLALHLAGNGRVVPCWI